MFQFCSLFKLKRLWAGLWTPVFFLFLSQACVLAQDSKLEDAKDFYNKSILKAETAWKSKVEKLVRYSGSMTVSMQMNGSNPNSEKTPVYSKIRGEWLTNFPNIVFDSEVVQSENAEAEPQVAFGCNKKYLFVLEKQSTADQWTINKVESWSKRIKSGDLWSFLLNPSDAQGLHMELCSLYSKTFLSEFILPDDTTSIMSLTSSPLCEVNQCEMLDSGALRMHFTINKTENSSENAADVKKNSFPFQSGSIDFMPDDWRVIAATLSYGKWEESMQCEYDIENEIPTLASRKVKTTYGDGTFTEDETKYSFSKKTTDPTRFTLSHYGLPEPDFGTTGINWIRWIFLGVGLFAIGWGVWRLSRKRSNSADAIR